MRERALRARDSGSRYPLGLSQALGIHPSARAGSSGIVLTVLCVEWRETEFDDSKIAVALQDHVGRNAEGEALGLS